MKIAILIPIYGGARPAFDDNRLAEQSRRRVIIDCWRLLGEDAPGGAVEIVRLGRPLETSVA